MTVEELVNALSNHSNACNGCGYEHNCNDKCALMQEAAKTLIKLNDFENSQCAKLLGEIGKLKGKSVQGQEDRNKELIRKSQELSAFASALANNAKTTDELNAYFIMEQQIDNALLTCMVTLYHIRKKAKEKPACVATTNEPNSEK